MYCCLFVRKRISCTLEAQFHDNKAKQMVLDSLKKDELGVCKDVSAMFEDRRGKVLQFTDAALRYKSV